MAPKYTRVKDKATGHEYDVLTHKFDKEKHEHVTRDGWPDSTYPRAAKPNVKSPRPTTETTEIADSNEVPASSESAEATETASRPKRARAPKANPDQDAAGA